MNKLKVLVCALACDPKAASGLGGGEDVLGWNIISQVRKFSEVWVLSSPKNKGNVEIFLKNNDVKNLHFYYIDFPRWLRPMWSWWGGNQMLYYFWQIKAYFVAKKLHKEIKFDVFHHVTYANDWMASYIGALLPVPYMRGPGGGAHQVPKSFAKEFAFKQKIAEKSRGTGQWVFRHDPFFIIGQNRAKALLVCNKEAFNALPKKWQKKAYFFPVNGISSGDLILTKTEGKRTGDKFLILTAGKLIKIKGFDLAIKAFKIFSERFPIAEFVIVGDGPEAKSLKSLVSKLKLEGKVIFENWMPREKLLEKMTQCDVFLFPSLRDGGGNVVVEAMAAAAPVVCFDLAGPGFHIDQNCGIKIKPESPKQSVKDMALALEKLYLDKGLREKLGKGAREKAEKDYDWDKLGDKLNEIYKKVL